MEPVKLAVLAVAGYVAYRLVVGGGAGAINVPTSAGVRIAGGEPYQFGEQVIVPVVSPAAPPPGAPPEAAPPLSAYVSTLGPAIEARRGRGHF